MNSSTGKEIPCPDNAGTKSSEKNGKTTILSISDFKSTEGLDLKLRELTSKALHNGVVLPARYAVRPVADHSFVALRVRPKVDRSDGTLVVESEGVIIADDENV